MPPWTVPDFPSSLEWHLTDYRKPTWILTTQLWGKFEGRKTFSSFFSLVTRRDLPEGQVSNGWNHQDILQSDDDALFPAELAVIAHGHFGGAKSHHPEEKEQVSQLQRGQRSGSTAACGSETHSLSPFRLAQGTFPCYGWPSSLLPLSSWQMAWATSGRLWWTWQTLLLRLPCWL